MSQKSDPRPAVQDLFDAVRGIFKKYTKTARERAWDGFTSSQGQAAVHRLIKDPKAPVTGVYKFLRFREFVEGDDME